MSLENIMLNEINQTQNGNIVWFHLHEVPRIGKFIELEGGIEVIKDLSVGWEKWGVTV